MLSRLTTDTTVIQNAVGSSISMGLRNAVLFVGGIAMLIATSPRLMLTVVGIIALVVAPAMLIGRRVRRLSRASQDRIADTSAIAGEVLNAVQVVQSYTQEHSGDAPLPRCQRARPSHTSDPAHRHARDADRVRDHRRVRRRCCTDCTAACRR